MSDPQAALDLLGAALLRYRSNCELLDGRDHDPVHHDAADRALQTLSALASLREGGGACKKVALYEVAAEAFSTGDYDIMEEALGRGSALDGGAAQRALLSGGGAREAETLREALRAIPGVYDIGWCPTGNGCADGDHKPDCPLAALASRSTEPTT